MISKEEKAVKYLRKEKILKEFKSCPHCKKKLEFRYNNRKQNLFDAIISKLYYKKS